MTFNIILLIIITVSSGILILAILFFLRERNLRKMLKKGLESPDAMEEFREAYPAAGLAKRSLRMEKLAENWGKSVVIETGTAPFWAEKLDRNPGKKDLSRVLRYCPPSYWCRAFLAGLKNEKLKSVLSLWINETGPEQALREISRSCRGEDFSNTDAMEFLLPLLETIDPVIELTGAPEWHTRYFAYQMLLDKTEEKKSRRALWDGFLDTHPLIRRTLAERFSTEEKKKLYSQLWDLLLEDPAFEVRQTAKRRILTDFPDLYSPSEKKLTGTPALRFLQLLEDDSPEESNLAIEFLKNPDLELRFPAATYLEKNGVLERMLLESRLEDKEELNRNYTLLKMALEVNVTSFLTKIDTSSSPGALLTAAKLLNQGGNRMMITPLSEAVFAWFKDNPAKTENIEIYTTLIKGIRSRGDDSALLNMRRELESRKNDETFLKFLLPAVPVRGDSIFIPALIRFLKTPDFPCGELLLSLLEKMPAELLLPDIFKILDGVRENYPHPVRIAALRLLARLKLPYCLQCILEHLPILPREEAVEFATIINEYSTEAFEKKTAALLKSTDGRIRAALIRILPAIKNKTFIKEVRGALKDADPDVRIAAIEALLGFGEIRLLNQETSMLRDPVERVRLATAKVIGEFGIPAALMILEEILQDENETTPVKKAAITGLGASATSGSLNLLISMLDQALPYSNELIAGLSMRRSKKDLMVLIENFRNGSPALKESLIKVFKLQEEESEPALLKLIEEGDASLRPYISEILNATGYIGKTIRKLSHREIRIRRQAAEWLSKLESTAGYRGLVMAARDPDQEIRVTVVKALERLNTPAGTAILDELKNDPDKRIRKYTRWAMERIKALSLD